MLFGELVRKWEGGIEDRKVVDLAIDRWRREIKSVINVVVVVIVVLAIELGFKRIVFQVARRRKCAGRRRVPRLKKSKPEQKRKKEDRRERMIN